MVLVEGSPVLRKWLSDVLEVNPRVDPDYLSHAYRFSEQAHREQHRQSGEQYLFHPMAVALELARLNLDTVTVAAGLLHDVLEDTRVTKDQLTEEFGPDVAFLVEGVTKISGLEFRSQEEAQAENFRKMLLSMAQDLRVILIKLADRLHNMRTLGGLDRRKVERIARETLDVYAPLAHRFGINRFKTELEDLALALLEPEDFKNLAEDMETDKRRRMIALEEVRRPIQEEIDRAGIAAEITWRHKSYFSIYNKMHRKTMGLEEIYDIVALRIVAERTLDCYHMLGIVHHLFVPISHRFKDFIANPKSNGYQSIHTTVVGPHGEPVEIQIRTQEMHRIAEEGIAAHWKYKEGKAEEEGRSDPWDPHVRWIRGVIERQTDASDPQEFLEHLKLELFESEVYVFTPRGDVVQLPADSTPLDFAFAVHTDVGLHCQGAKVDGRIVPLDHRLRSGDHVEILTSSHQRPNQSWLRMVKSSKARTNIKRYLREQQAEQSIRLGQEMLERELKRARIKPPAKDELTDLAQSVDFATLADLFEALGRGTLRMERLLKKLRPEETPAPDETSEGFLQRLVDRARSTVRGVSVQGEGNLMIHFARCCQPIPGDRIVGYVTRGRGLTVHRADCPNLVRILEDPGRVIDVAWDTDKDQNFLAGISVRARDRINLLNEVSRAISSESTNIKSVNMTTGGGEAVGHFVVEVRNLQQLQRVMKRVRRIKGVEQTERLTGPMKES
jgi:guanosine-3',5'-bis(diphosphate) 3'-pyrophosphohydrolase